ncbi:TetR family transcriptional regulator [Amycolatopsis antarctica]|uniref:TetR family transcriptional regulator n=1 Tax=Amycolatopsis antarctica TaxID=1854586 RepID=A0A263D4K6_9PSEU|nr:TetR/AcrR family transcriptional regulator [Amycolatopsis antarctica]OZM72406.1 TetR family transcriptional regulator [Amycolatopsis antarctica]
MQVNETWGAEIGHTPTEATRRAQIVTAAIEVIDEHGYAKASFARIVERAGLSSTRMISYHFANRNDLMWATALTVMESMDSYLGERLDTTGGRASMLGDYIRAEVGFLGAQPKQVRALVEISAQARERPDSPIIEAVWRDLRTGRLERQLTQGQREGAFGEFDIRVMAMAIRQSIDGVALRLAGEPDLDVDDYGAQIADLFLRATAA